MAFATCVPTVLDKRRALPWGKALLVCGILSSLLYGAMSRRSVQPAVEHVS